jgi:glutaminyl-tRNA synthetase
VSAAHCINAEIRLYDRLFSQANPLADRERHFTEALNPDSLEILRNCRVEMSLVKPLPDTRYQFERTGYFYLDSDNAPNNLIFNRIVTLRDTWARISG